MKKKVLVLATFILMLWNIYECIALSSVETQKTNASDAFTKGFYAGRAYQMGVCMGFEGYAPTSPKELESVEFYKSCEREYPEWAKELYYFYLDGYKGGSLYRTRFRERKEGVR